MQNTKILIFCTFFSKREHSILSPTLPSLLTPAPSLSAVNSHRPQSIFMPLTNSVCLSHVQTPAWTFHRGHQGHEDLIVFLLNFLSPPEPAVTQLLQSGNNREWQEHPQGNTQRIAFLFKNTSTVTCSPAPMTVTQPSAGLHSLISKALKQKLPCQLSWLGSGNLQRFPKAWIFGAFALRSTHRIPG